MGVANNPMSFEELEQEVQEIEVEETSNEVVEEQESSEEKSE